MRMLDASNAEAYLRESGRLALRERVEVRRLSGGVSNEVLYVASPEGSDNDFVLKQARGQLRVADPWFCDVDRIWREAETLRVCESILSRAAASDVTTPRILFEDRENYCFAMTAAPRDHQVWKTLLLQGQVDPRVAERCGWLLGTLHAGSWGDEAVAERLADRRVFDELRLDPYYRFTAEKQPDAAGHFQRLIASVWDHSRCLVHADFSPKNLLVYSGGMMMVDFETGHYGDPAFDLGFFTSHLALKAFHRLDAFSRYWELIQRFWAEYRQQMQTALSPDELRRLEARAIQNLAGCAWARLDGKSKIDYLDDPSSAKACGRSAGSCFEFNRPTGMKRSRCLPESPLQRRGNDRSRGFSGVLW